jgi:hypothetical protein
MGGRLISTEEAVIRSCFLGCHVVVALCVPNKVNLLRPVCEEDGESAVGWPKRILEAITFHRSIESSRATALLQAKKTGRHVVYDIYNSTSRYSMQAECSEDIIIMCVV